MHRLDFRRLVDGRCLDQEMPISCTDFERLCRECNLSVANELLEECYRYGLLRPLCRMNYTYVDNGEVRRRGFHWHGEYMSHYLEDGGVTIAPRDIVLWRSESPGEWCYSRYQIVQVGTINARLTILLCPSLGTESSEEVWKRQTDYIRMTRDSLQRANDDFERLLYLLLLIQNKYLPRIKQGVTGWNHWKKWCKRFRPLKALKLAGVTTDEVQHWYEKYSWPSDPIRSWKLLVDHISYDQRQRLSGSALLARWHYKIAEMLRALLNDIGIPTKREDEEWATEFYGQKAILNRHRMLGYLCSQYGIHPSPHFYLFVEDRGLYERFIPVVANALYGHDLEGS